MTSALFTSGGRGVAGEQTKQQSCQVRFARSQDDPDRHAIDTRRYSILANIRSDALLRSLHLAGLCLRTFRPCRWFVPHTSIGSGPSPDR
nr:hypothetical protein CFP56_20643 [Quercus suber]